MSGRPKWRSRHPVKFFFLGELFSIALAVAGTVMLTAADNHVPPTQPADALGGWALGIGVALMFAWLIWGMLALGRHLFRSARGSRAARPDRTAVTRQDSPRERAARSDPPRRTTAQNDAARAAPARARTDRPRTDQARTHQARTDQARTGSSGTANRGSATRPRGPAPGDGTVPADDTLPADRRVKVLMVGDSGSGKTTLLATLYHCFALGGSEGIRFAADDAANISLRGLLTTVRNSGAAVVVPGTRTGETRTWEFAVRVESGDEEATAFTLEYLDYPGAYVQNRFRADLGEPLDPRFENALASADVLMGILDGASIGQLMNGSADTDAIVPIENLLYILVQAGQRNVHLVVTKWDLVRGPGGAQYSINDVLSKLDQESSAFRSFRRSPRLGNMRVIPVSALGLNGFVRADPSVRGGMAKVAGKPWDPWNSEVPFYCAVPDILRHDVAKLDGRINGNIARITNAVLDVVGIGQVEVSVAGVIKVTVPVGEVLARIWQYVHDANQRGRVPDVLNDKAAISYVLNECYTQVGEFERHFPESRLQRPAADA